MYDIIVDGDIMAVIKHFEDKKYDKVLWRMSKDKKKEIKAYAEACGYSLDSFVNKAIEEKSKILLPIK